MNNVLKAITSAFILFFVIAYGSKKTAADNMSDVPIFGTYRFDSDLSIIQLKEDSVAFMDIRNITIKKGADGSVIHSDGRFIYRNNSIFINWETGRQVKSKFEKKDGYYSFRNGANTYKRKL